MAKSVTKSRSRQELAVVHTATVEVPLPLLAALEDVEHAFVGVCIEAGERVLGAMMEQDRTRSAVCPGSRTPLGRDGEREARRVRSRSAVGFVS